MRPFVKLLNDLFLFIVILKKIDHVQRTKLASRSDIEHINARWHEKNITLTIVSQTQTNHCSTSFTLSLSSNSVTESSLKIPPHHKYVPTLPCVIHLAALKTQRGQWAGFCSILYKETNADINRNTARIQFTDWVKVLHTTRHKTGPLGDDLHSQSLGIVLKKLNLSQQKHTYTNNPKKLNLTQINCNTQYNHRKAKSNQQTTVRSVPMCVHCTVHNCCTQYCTEQTR